MIVACIQNKMKFSSIIYPAPNPASYTHDKLVGELLYVPRDYKDCPDLYDIDGRMSVGAGFSSNANRANVSMRKERQIEMAQNKKQQRNQLNQTVSYQSTGGLQELDSNTTNNSTQQKNKNVNPYSNFVPCLYLPYLKGSNKLIIFFHGNAEDLGISYEMLDHLRTALKINVMAVEYPGYGVYEDPEGPSEEKIFRDADLVYNFVQAMTLLKQKDIILLGRSLGSGPSTYLASKYEPGGLILMSPYTSMKAVATSKVGWLSVLLAQQFDNLSKMETVYCPTFIVHGQKDALIPMEQAQQLNDACSGPTFLLSPPNMTHNDFDFYEDLIRPLMKFLVQANILQPLEESEDEEDSEIDMGEDGQELCRSEIVKLKGSTNVLDLTNSKGFGGVENLSATQRLQAEANQVRFSEEFFIPPRLKQNYIKRATDTYFNQMMFHTNNPERHTVAGIAGPTQIKSKTMLRKNVSSEESQSKTSSKGLSKKNEKPALIKKKSIDPQQKKQNSARRPSAPNPITGIDRNNENSEIVPLQQQQLNVANIENKEVQHVRKSSVLDNAIKQQCIKEEIEQKNQEQVSQVDLTYLYSLKHTTKIAENLQMAGSSSLLGKEIREQMHQ